MVRERKRREREREEGGEESGYSVSGFPCVCPFVHYSGWEANKKFETKKKKKKKERSVTGKEAEE